MGSPALNLAAYLVLCAALPGIPGIVLAVLRRRAARAAARPAEPHRPPIEQIVADLHRLSCCARDLPAGTTFVRHRGVELAYDDVLVLACRALEIPTELRALAPGWERDVERLRVEACLVNAGLPVRTSGS